VVLAALLATTAAPAVAADTDVDPTPAAESAAPAEDAPAETPPADEAPADEAPSEEAPADEAPAEEAPVEDAPAAKAPNSIDTTLKNVSALAIVPGEASTLTVNSAGVAADATPGDGVCDTGATVGDPAVPECTLRAALQEANAVVLDGTAPSSITIDFTDLGLVSYGAGDVAGSLMSTALVGNVWGSMGAGASFVVDSVVPVTLDFANLDGIEHADDSIYALFEVRSDNVTLRNAGSMRAGEAAIAISGSNVSVDNVIITDEATPNLEVGIGLLDGASNVAVTNSSIISAFFVGVLVDASASVSNITFDNVTSRGHGAAHFDIEDGATVNGFTISNSQVGRPTETAPSPHVYLNPLVSVTGLQLLDSTFESPNQYGIGVYGGGVTLTDTVVDGSEFNGTGPVMESTSATITGLDVTDNTFDDTLGGVLDFEAATVSDATIARNAFTDARGNAEAGIDIGRVSPEQSVIEDNTFTQAADSTSKNRWAVLQRPFDQTPDEDTGWTIQDNAIDGYVPDEGPITNRGLGKSIVQRNTFGPDTRGTQDTISENGLSWFVVNGDAFNDRIQTYRPTRSAFTDDELTVEVAPVDPVLAGNTAPTTPVSVDVYWTADDNAEVYVGRIEDVEGRTTESFDFTGGEGFVRVQTIDATGRASQYSGTVQAPEDTEAPAPVVIEDAPQDGPVTGTGESGATVVIFDEDGNVVGVGEVEADGSFSVDLDEALDCDVEYTAVQFDLAGNDSAPVTFTPDGCEAGGGDGDGDGGDTGAGGAGGDQASDGAALPDTGSPAGLLALLVAGLAAIATGVVTARRRSA
jgi:adhesin/invasin